MFTYHIVYETVNQPPDYGDAPPNYDDVSKAPESLTDDPLPAERVDTKFHPSSLPLWSQILSLVI